LITDAHGTPLAAILTGANCHDVTQLLPLVDAVPTIRGKAGRPLSRVGTLLADRGYDSDPHRAQLRKRGITPRIARRYTENGSGLGRFRYVVEQTHALLHQFRRLRTRFEKRGYIHEALLELGCAIFCWRRHNHGYF